jgi:hypothetical protein
MLRPPFLCARTSMPSTAAVAAPTGPDSAPEVWSPCGRVKKSLPKCLQIDKQCHSARIRNNRSTVVLAGHERAAMRVRSSTGEGSPQSDFD